jgi:hypothetical protein
MISEMTTSDGPACQKYGGHGAADGNLTTAAEGPSNPTAMIATMLAQSAATAALASQRTDVGRQWSSCARSMRLDLLVAERAALSEIAPPRQVNVRSFR